jgi:hypothetical protein
VRINLQKRDRRAIAILGGALIAYLLLSWAVLPIYNTLSGSEIEALEKERLLQKYREVIGRRNRYSSLTEEASRQVKQAEERVIRSATPSLGAVEFQTLVETAARKFDIALMQRNVAPGNATNDALREITMTLAFEGTPRQLVSLLTELRAAPKSIRVMTMNVNPVESAQEVPKDRSFSKNIRVNMTLRAWIENTVKETMNER